MQVFVIAHHDKGRVYALKEVVKTTDAIACIWTSITSPNILTWDTFEVVSEYYKENIKDKTASYIFAVEA